MPGKGVRRREKNFRAAHGGGERLAPPPKQRDLDALPSKLRRLIAIQNKQSGTGKSGAGAEASAGGAPGKQGADGTTGKNSAGKDKKTKKRASETAADAETAEDRGEGEPAADEDVNVDGGKRKRKRGKAMDLRFKELDANVSITKKQKRKNYLDEKKKKRKVGKVETHLDFPGHEKVKFGEIVVAPPKLLFPKVKKPLDASRERLRKEAVENYRNIKGWTSRLGLQLPTVADV